MDSNRSFIIGISFQIQHNAKNLKQEETAMKTQLISLALVLMLFCSCASGGKKNVDVAYGSLTDSRDGKKEAAEQKVAEKDVSEQEATEQEAAEKAVVEISTIIRNAELPENLAKKIEDAFAENPAFIAALNDCLKVEECLRKLVDKQHPLPPDYIPDDLVMLEEGNYLLIRVEPLRRVAAESLGEMSAAARANGITLAISSSYRPYDYQAVIYNRNVRELGKEIADRESAAPGYSQHQTGLVVDFHPVKDSFATTKAGKWLAANASRFGWSISYPKGYEAVTGYKWESWHWRYVGKEIAAFIDNYFEGIQQYALRFLHEWGEKETHSTIGEKQ
jgi:D-alanyl-D-alanine carboxypeptidase